MSKPQPKNTIEAMGGLVFERCTYDISELTDLILNTPLASGMSPPQLELIAKHGRAFAAPKGTTIVMEGANHSYMGVLLKGKAQVVKKDTQGNEKVMSTFAVGKTFGEMSMIDGEPRSASVIATEDSVVLVLTQDTFVKLASENPLLGIKLLFRICKVISQRLRQTTGRLIDHLET